MKPSDWNGQPRKLLAQCFADHNSVNGVSFKLNAAFEEEALNKVRSIVHKQHGPFERKTSGQYHIKFSDITQQPTAH